MQAGRDRERPRLRAALQVPRRELAVLGRGQQKPIAFREGEVRRCELERDVGADERLRLDRRTDLLQCLGISDGDPSVATAEVVQRAWSDELDEPRGVLREREAHGDACDGRLRQPLARTGIQETDVLIAADREDSAVSAEGEALRGVMGQRLSDRLESPRVVEHEAGSVTDGRQRASVRADRDSPEGGAVAVHDPDRGRASTERGEEVASGLWRVVDRDRLACEQEGEVEIVPDEGLRPETLCELRRLRVARLAPLDEREAATDDRRDEQDSDAGEQPAQAPVRASGSLRFLLGEPHGSR